MKNSKLLWVGLFSCLLLTQTEPLFGQEKNPLRKPPSVVYQAPDTSMRIKFNARMQNRLEVDNQTSEGLAPSEVLFFIRRFRLKSSGFLINPRLKYKLELAFSKRDVSPQLGQWGNNLYDAYIDYALSPNLGIRFGQFKLPGNRQRVISSGSLALVDRSPANGAYNLDRDVGVMLAYEKKLGQAEIRYNVALSNGEGRNILSTRYEPNKNEINLAVTQRVEFLPFGDFTKGGDYFEADLVREETPKLSVGGGYYYNHDAIRSQGQLGSQLLAPRDINSTFADMIFKYQGFSMMAEYLQMGSQNPVTMEEDKAVAVKDGDGFMVQAGYVWPSLWGIAGRYSEINPTVEVLDFQQAETEAVLGVSRYLNRHTIKVQTDIAYLTDREAAPEFQNYWRWRFQVELGF